MLLSAHGIVLQHCTSLENLTLFFSAGCPYVGWIGATNCLAGFPACLLPYFPLTVRVVTLSFAQKCASRLLQPWINSVDFGALQQALLSLENFEMLKIMYTAQSSDTESAALPPSLQTSIRDALPALEEIGKLAFPDSMDE